MKNKKYYFPVTYVAEGISEGYMKLSRAEAQVVARATNPDNWTDATIEMYSGRFGIDINHSIPEEWFEYHKSQMNRYA